MDVSSWGVPATGSLTYAAGGTVQTEAGGQQCQLFQRRQGKPGLFSLANKAEMEYDRSLQVYLGYKYQKGREELFKLKNNVGMRTNEYKLA